MLHAAPPSQTHDIGFVPHAITIRRDEGGYGIRFGLTEAEDALMHGPVFDTLDEALAWVDAIDRRRLGGGRRPDPAT